MTYVWNRCLDVALLNGRVLTQDGAVPVAEAVGISGNRFALVGSNEDVQAGIGSSTKVIDLQGRTVIPGVFDSHNHIVAGGMLMEGVMFFGIDTIDGMKEVVAKKAAELPKGEWIRGGGWIESQFKEYRLPTRWDLDEAAPDHPVIINRLFGASLVNSKALELAGITAATPDPEVGQIDRDPKTGEPTGLLRNGAQNLVHRVIPRASVRDEVARMESLIKRATDEYVKWGITSIIDPGVSPLAMRAYHNLYKRNELPLRVQMMPAWYGLYSVDSQHMDYLLETLGVTFGFGDEWLNMGALKMAIDGGVGSKTALLNDPYIDGHVSTIPLRLDMEQLEAYFRKAVDAGWSIGIHTCGDMAQDMACRLFDKVLSSMPPQENHRHNIIHGYLPTEEALEIMARHNIGVSVQPGFMYVEGDIYFDQLDERRINHYKPLKTYVERGILTAANSDMTSAHYNPFYGMYSAVARKTSQGRSMGEKERVSREEMLPLFTINGAKLAGQEERIGSITPGKLADLAVLSDNILTVSDEDIMKLTVELTIIDGKVVWQK